MSNLISLSQEGVNIMKFLNYYRVKVTGQTYVVYSEEEAKQLVQDEKDRLTAKGFINLLENVAYTTHKMSHATYIGYSDREAYEVIRVVSDKTVEVRLMDAELITKMEFTTGGFSAHCDNNSQQEYNYSSNEENPVIRLRKSKSGFWLRKGSKFAPAEEPYKFHDYNF